MTMDLIDMDPWGPVTSALLSSYIIDPLWDHDHCLGGLSSCTHFFSSMTAFLFINDMPCYIMFTYGLERYG